MSTVVPEDKQCYFKVCRYEALHVILFRGKEVKVCQVHDNRYGYSHETGNKRVR